MNNLPDLLPNNVVSKINSFIDANIKFEERPLKEGVFNILRKYAVLVFYPLEENEENDAFLLRDMPWEGDKKHFVFINSAKTKEKQVFAAAHELGHILGIIDYLGIDKTQEELVVNRMAAEILMPEDLFLERIRKLGIKKQLTKELFLEIVIGVMNEFSCTFEAVVLRFYELGLLERSDAEAFIFKKAIDNQDDYVHRIIVEKKFEELLVVTKEKNIDGLSQIINELTKRGQLTPKAMRLKKKYATFIAQDEKNILDDNLKININ
ncbi:ImmA/IrrE family metallo-endopeptidase [Pseudobutyrivibrio sp.]|uniref:ImmA/IrrE family metallo-endopeptidase n=1 Tax=Pseudobutyrivibrio sp. TaxID=2014367 RepID=UPI001DD2E9CB|nr:ImmA/IrrE family metallo-endopeptidase [Pseudobutyrivibrio sp.]MBE5912366.1 ImmA/IrrE family metallo-endopeptidase [Pseudobutyrivibrio sp.]